jgi:chromosome segregation ATPase
MYEARTMSDEVELSDPDSDEYEVIPLDPIRKLERRIDEMEQKSELSREEGLIRDVVDIMKTNQQMVNNMVDSTNNLKTSVEELTHKMDTIIDDIGEFLDLLEEASEASLEQDINRNIEDSLVSPLTNKMEEIVETNQQMLEGLSSVGEHLNKMEKKMQASTATQESSPRRRAVRRTSNQSGGGSGGGGSNRQQRSGGNR